MSTTNPVFSILPTSGNQAVLAAGSRPDALAVGQIGFFNYHTGLSVDGTVAQDARDIFIAVGVPNSGGTLGDIRKSAGQVIQTRHARGVNFKGYVADAPKIVDLSSFVVKCATDYVIRVELRNQEAYYRFGYNALSKIFTFQSAACADQCVACGDGDCNEVVLGLAAQVNADKDRLMTASFFANQILATVTAGAGATANITITVGATAYTVPVTNGNTAAQVAAAIVATVNNTANSPYRAAATSAALTFYSVKTSNTPAGTFALTNANGTGVTVGTIVANAKVAVADATAAGTFITNNPGVCLGIRFTGVPQAIRTYFGTINQKYIGLRNSDIIVTLKDGFTGNGDTVIAQQLQFAEGVGYDIKEEEDESLGWEGSPYRQQGITGLAKDQKYPSLAVVGTNYNTFHLHYDQQSVGGWLEYLNNLRTVIAIPCGDATTMSGVATVLDLIFTQFGAMANDIAANGDCTNTRTGLLTPATDGIEMVTT